MRKRIPTTYKYTIKRYYESADQAGNFIEDKSKEEVVEDQTPGQKVELSPTQTNAPEGFSLIDGTVTRKKVNKDGTTVFELKYKRHRYRVNFEVNYNNHFEGVNVSSEPTQTIPYEGKVRKPEFAPSLAKDGYTYTFKHWQLKDEMGNVYREVTAFDFDNTQITKNITLVAYFEETINNVTYKVVHYLEKTGKDNTLNGQYERIEEIKTDQKVEDGAAYHEYLGLDHQLYEKHVNHPGNKLNVQLNAGDNSVEVCQYYKLKEVEVKFKKTDGIATFSYEMLKVKKTRSVVLPTYTLKNTHNFAGWALSANGQTQNEFVVDKATTNLEIYAKTDYTDREIIYTIKKENADGSFDVSHEKKTGKIASNHTAFYANPDSSIYKEPEVSPKNLTINADNNQNKVTVNILRRTHQVTFEVKGHSSLMAARIIKHGAKIGTIDESEFVKDGLSIRKIDLDGKEATKKVIENHVVYKSHKVTVYISKTTRKIGKYPQTLVNNPKGIQLLDNELHEIKFNSKSKDYSLNFTRSYWKDNEGNKYEKYNGKYFKFEDVYFVKMPNQNTWFTEKIIDYSQLNIFYWDAPENAKIERTMFKSLVLDIGKVIGETVYMPNYNDNDEFSVKPAIQEQKYSELQKKSTDYAKEVMGDYGGTYISFYRGTNLSPYVESGVHMPFHHNAHYNSWTLGTQINNSAPGAFYVYKDGRAYDSYLSNRVLGVVVCVK